MIECGFEFEFGYDIHLDLFKQILKHHYPKNKIYTLTEDSDISKIMSKNYFIFKEDYSVFVENCKYKSIELATPVFSGKKEILLNFKKIFDILTLLNIKTNKTCSIHINSSFSTKEETYKIDFGKLYLYINEWRLLKLFNRTNNRYSIPCISRNKILNMMNGCSAAQVISRFEKQFLFTETHHNMAIALDKSKNGEIYILEFRFIGGDYINNFDKANHILSTIIDAMLFSIGENKQISSDKVLLEFKKYHKKEKRND